MKIKVFLLNLAALAAVSTATWLTYDFAQQPGWLAKAMTCIFAYAALRIAWEMTVNRHSVPTIASAPAVRRQVAALIADDFEKRNRTDIAAEPYRVVDLGAGRGELARAIACGVRGATVTGVERAWIPHWRAKVRQHLLGPGNLQCLRGDLFAYDCTGASAVVLFLGKLTVPAGAKLWRELQPGSLVISNDFELGGDWKIQDRIALRTPFKTVLYIYRR